MYAVAKVTGRPRNVPHCRAADSTLVSRDPPDSQNPDGGGAGVLDPGVAWGDGLGWDICVGRGDGVGWALGEVDVADGCGVAEGPTPTTARSNVMALPPLDDGLRRPVAVSTSV